MSEYIVNLDGELGMALAVACAGAGFAREEIVRCRDCTRFDRMNDDEGICMLPDDRGNCMRFMVDDCGYCYRGIKEVELPDHSRR